MEAKMEAKTEAKTDARPRSLSTAHKRLAAIKIMTLRSDEAIHHRSSLGKELDLLWNEKTVQRPGRGFGGSGGGGGGGPTGGGYGNGDGGRQEPRGSRNQGWKAELVPRGDGRYGPTREVQS